MKTVPLHGKKAVGRVALVDDEDYELVMQYRWHVHQPGPKPGCRPKAPYAIANHRTAPGKYVTIRMHILIMGAKGIDHRDHNGLNNQRSNLRVATASQNSQNMRRRSGGTSRFKGVCWVKESRLWQATIRDGRVRVLGRFPSELEAAYAYDAAARASYGDFAYTNFPEGPTQAMRDQWAAEREARKAEISRRRTERQPEAYVCVECGAEYLSNGFGKKLYCGAKCRNKAKGRWRTERKRQQRAVA